MIDETTSTPCPWDELISAFLDGELDETEAQALEAHLASHAECRSELDEVARVRQRVRTLPMRSGTPAFWLRVVEDVAADRPSSPTSRDRAAIASPARLRWASVAASMVILAAGIAGTRGGDAPASPGPGTTVSRAGVIAGITATRGPDAGVSESGSDADVVVDVTSTTGPSVGSDREWLQQIADAVNDVLN